MWPGFSSTSLRNTASLRTGHPIHAAAFATCGLPCPRPVTTPARPRVYPRWFNTARWHRLECGPSRSVGADTLRLLGQIPLSGTLVGSVSRDDFSPEEALYRIHKLIQNHDHKRCAKSENERQ